MMKRYILIILTLSLTLITSCEDDSQSGEIYVVSPEEMESLLSAENVQLVDVRTPQEYTSGHIEFAQNIDFKSATFNEDIKRLDKDKPVMLYCNRGGRSAMCAQKMLDAGFKKIYDLKGGFSKWRHKGLAIKIKS